MARLRALSKADLQLWAAFSQGMQLLPGRQILALPEAPQPVSHAAAAFASAVNPQPRKLPAPLILNAPRGGLDKATWKNFASGKIPAIRRLDLHGLYAATAHRAVSQFIERAYAEQARCVEIITGKGEVLARELPHWLNAPGLEAMILAAAHAPTRNTGAVRLLLRKKRV